MQQDAPSALRETGPGLSPAAGGGRTEVLDALRAGPGYALVRRAPGQTVELALAAFSQLVQELGENVSRNELGETVPHAVIRSTADPSFRGAYVGAANSSQSIPLHTDGSGDSERTVEILAMFCERQAARGGETLLCDPAPVVAGLSPRERALLREPWPRRHPNRPDGPEAFVFRPILADGPGGISFSYGFRRLELGLDALADGARSERAALLDKLNARLEGAIREVRLGDGDFIVLDNRRILHGRRAFADDPASPRRLLRVWLGQWTPSADSP